MGHLQPTEAFARLFFETIVRLKNTKLYNDLFLSEIKGLVLIFVTLTGIKHY